MKQQLRRTVLLFLASITLLAACKKEDTTGIPNQPGRTNQVQFVVDSLPGETTVNGDVYALFTIMNDRNETVMSNQRLSFTFNGKYITEKITLSPGSFRVVRFQVVNGSNVTRFAAPVTGSAKAPQVQRPLAVAFALPEITVKSVGIDVLKVESGDQPESFGYPAGSFNLPPAGAETFFRVRLKAVVNIGDITYDSIPASFTIQSWDQQGIVHTKDTIMGAGVHEIQLPQSHTKYRVSMSKWGLSEEIILMKNQVVDGALYTLAASRAAKKLQQEMSYAWQGGEWLVYEKRNFAYDGQGRLSEILTYTRDPYQGTLKLSTREVLTYQGNEVHIDAFAGTSA
ncbi:MAG TPA: hypothetical protein VFZ78_08440 [Flavisolibacter sp.]